MAIDFPNSPSPDDEYVFNGRTWRWDGTAWNAVGESASGIRMLTWAISSPAVGGIVGPRIPENMTVTRVDAYVDAATSATFNIEERGTIGSAGTNIMSADMAADVTGESDTGAFNNDSLAAGNWLWVDISAVSGTPTQLVITLTCTVD